MATERRQARVLRTAALLAALPAVGCVHSLKFPRATLPTGLTGAEYSAKLDLGSCDTRIVTAEVDSGELPSGVGLSFSHEAEAHNLVLLQGVPRDAGTYKFVLGAWCKGREADSDEVRGRYVLKVNKGKDAAGLHFDDKDPPAGTVGMAYEAKIPIGKCAGPFEDVDVPKGKLPPGLRATPANDDTGDFVRLKGTPKKAGTFKFSLLAACGSPEHSLEQGAQLTHSYIIKIDAAEGD